jgi:hypothetical protein
MTDNQQFAVSRYAVLIGINAYQDKPLKGCVQDVQNIKEFLEKMSNHIDIRIFTATESANSKSPRLIEDPMIWPTYDNVTSALRNMTSQAKAGDLVYIHYSGHGTRVEPYGEFSNKSTGDLALLLLHGEEGGVKCLWGPRLALAMKAMVDKGLVVTLVLDCCFCASVYRRGDPSIRFLACDAEIDADLRLDSLDEESLARETGGRGNRDVSMRANWLTDPDGYAILAACAPDKEASDFKSEDGQIHGALSYFLLLTLMTYGLLGKRHKDVYDHLQAQFKKLWPQQKPVLYGNKDQGFFGHTRSEIIMETVPIIDNQHGSLELQAGQAHGICVGDQFVVEPMNSAATDSGSRGDTLTAVVVHVRGLTSDLKLLDNTPTHFQIVGSARAVTRTSLRKFPIRLATDLPYRDEWPPALEKRSLNLYNDNGHPFSFQITVNSRKEYEVLDKCDQKVNCLPTMVQDQTDISSVCDVVAHLAKFELVRDLTNTAPVDPFRESFHAKIITSTGQTYYPGSLIETQHNEEPKFVLQVENKGDEELSVFVYDLGPRWQVQNILYASHEPIPPPSPGFTGIFEKKFKTAVPSGLDQDHRQFEDIIKVFVTSQPTTFDLLELPTLGEPAQGNGKNGGTRGRGNHSPDDWAALNFRVRTYIK